MLTTQLREGWLTGCVRVVEVAVVGIKVIVY